MRLLIEERQHFLSSSNVNDYTCQAGSHSLNTLFHFKSNNVPDRDSTKKMSLMTPSGGALCTEHIKNGHVHRAKRKKNKSF